MLFNSFAFLVFFLITFSVYYLPACKTIQIPILLVASLIFYSWDNPMLVILLIISMLLNGFTSFRVAHAPDKQGEFFWAFTGVTTNLAILGLFKYGSLVTHLFVDNLTTVNPEEGVVALLLHLPLPIGISFYTFQGISLVVDVFRNRDKDNSYVGDSLVRHLINTSFFIALFPQIIAGPIVKANTFFPQIKTKYFKYIKWDIVFRSLTVGYFLKMVVADNLKDYTYWITCPYCQGQATSTNLVLLFGYSMQIFADFAGYSIIAIGLGASLGYRFPENFNFPYISRSIAEFWRRWHISLSSWLRDYLYFPLGGNRKGNIRTYINLMIVMTLGGLWHGAAWSYAVWGMFHGFGLALERFLGVANKKAEEQVKQLPLWQQFILDSIRVIAVFWFVSLGWLLFKLPQFGEALQFMGALFNNIGKPPDLRFVAPILIFSLPVVIYHIPHFPTFEHLTNRYLDPSKNKVAKRLQNIALATMLFFILLNSGSSNEFIYFQF